MAQPPIIRIPARPNSFQRFTSVAVNFRYICATSTMLSKRPYSPTNSQTDIFLGPGPGLGTSCNAGSAMTPRPARRSMVTFTLSGRVPIMSAICRLFILAELFVATRERQNRQCISRRRAISAGFSARLRRRQSPARHARGQAHLRYRSWQRFELEWRQLCIDGSGQLGEAVTAKRVCCELHPALVRGPIFTRRT